MIIQINNLSELIGYRCDFKNDFFKSENPYTKYLLYVNDNYIIGFLEYEDIFDRFEIDNIFVSEEFRHFGFGTKLIEELIKIGKENNINNITLEVKINNYNALGLYNKMGFKKTAIREKYYNGIDGILMEKEMIKMDDVYILAIESSCDETACAIVRNGKEVLSSIVSSQIDIHTLYGGVVPEIASRMHIESITYVIDECFKQAKITMNEITAIAVTYGPGLIGSLLVGLEAAKTLSFIYKKPLVPVHHIAGHIYANNLEKEIKYPCLSLVISGGHTELVYIKEPYSFKVLGTTLDDAVGECYDKVARVIGVGYPGGPKIDKLASIGVPTYKLPIPLNDDSYNFSFSGLKSAVINLVHNEEQRGNEINRENLSASFQEVVTTLLSKKVFKAIKDLNVKYFVTAGGVAANSSIRMKLSKLCEENNVEYSFPQIKNCTDNAAMIGAAGYFAYKKGIRSDLLLNAYSTLKLE